MTPDNDSGTLITHPDKSGADNLDYAMASANKPPQFAFSGVSDLPIGKGRRFASGVNGIADKMVTRWTLP